MKLSNKILFIVIAFILCISTTENITNAESFSSSTSAIGVTFTHDITLGSSGSDVSALQQFLIDSGFLKIIAPTGYFGQLTKTSLGKWQASLGIYPSVGFFGSISRKKINTLIEQTTAKISLQSLFGTTTVTESVVATTTIGTTGGGSEPIKDGFPVRLTISKLNVNAGFQYTGFTSLGAMEIPNNIVDVGWFTSSVHPGEIGTAVITGHVTQVRGGIVTKPGVFYNLNELIVGDKLSIQNNKGEVVTFIAREIRNFDPKADATSVFVSKDNGAHLNLITCEGTWNPSLLSYSQRLVVFTDAVN